MITAQNILMHELIGLHGAVSDSAHPGLIGVSGRVTYETKSMLVLDTESGPKSVPKGVCSWTFEVGGAAVNLDGNRLVRRHAERLRT